VHDILAKQKTTNNLKIYLESTIGVVQNNYRAEVVGVVTNASAEC
jgi:hypothetical protein